MITVILNNAYLEFITRRYPTNSFDEALKLVVDDWVAEKIVWETEEIAAAFTPSWMKKNGYADSNTEPDVDQENEVVQVSWYWWDDEDELVVEARFIKSAPV